MAQAWGFVAEGTEAEGSAVALVTVPATLTCQDCGLTAETTDVLAIYEIDADTEGNLEGYRRLRRYTRGSAQEE